MQKRTFSFVSLGCAKNLVDSEEIMGSLINEGYLLKEKFEESRVVIINTCAFLKEARQEALETIREIVNIKTDKKNQLEKIVVVGCFAEYYNENKIKEMVPEVDLVVPIKKYKHIPYLLTNMLFSVEEVPAKAVANKKSRFISSSPHSVYIKIAEGCNNRCSYCLIPSLRGRLRSKSIDEIIDEVKAVQKLGAKEISLIAQDTTVYGFDLYGKYMITELLKQLCAINGIEWIRLLYAHPAHITKGLLKTISEERAICNYLDLPIQHASTKILGLMGRKIGRDKLISLYNNIRESIPGVVLRTTVMVGYPGETKEDFDELLDFLRKYPFERLGAFPFSPEKGTAAFKQGPRVSAGMAKKRLDTLMAQQKEISRAFNRQLLGKTTNILIDSYNPNRKNAYGRLFSQAPEVDGKVVIANVNGTAPGDFLPVIIRGAGTYDLLGEILLNEHGK